MFLDDCTGQGASLAKLLASWVIVGKGLVTGVSIIYLTQARSQSRIKVPCE